MRRQYSPEGAGESRGRAALQAKVVGRKTGLWYCDNVKNLTVSLPDEVYRRARVKAAERDTSLSALVRDFLSRLGQEETDGERRRRLQTEVFASIDGFSAGDRLSRDDVHGRRIR